MSAVFRQRARIARVRRIQHGLAASAAVRALGQVELLEGSAAQLARLRDGVGSDDGLTNGASLATRGELAMRLDTAREGLRDPIARAQKTAEAREGARLIARRDQESAEKLEQRAAKASARSAERRLSVRHRPRTRHPQEGDDN